MSKFPNFSPGKVKLEWSGTQASSFIQSEILSWVVG